VRADDTDEVSPSPSGSVDVPETLVDAGSWYRCRRYPGELDALDRAVMAHSCES
jgi:hypothetical protein